MRAIFCAAVAAVTLASGAAQAQGPASAPGMGMRGMRMDGANTYGWGLMTRAERQTHHDKMAAMKTYEECKSYRDEHHAQMAERAKARGGKTPAEPRRDPCAPLKK